MIRLYPVDPVSAPRQVRSHAWNPTSHVKRYRAYQTELLVRGLQIPTPVCHLIFVMPIPPSWSERKKAEHDGQPHQQKPDRDNLEKAVLDTAFGEDCHLWHGATSKIWGRRGVLLVSDRIIPMEQCCPLHMDRVYEACNRWRLNEPPHEQRELLLVADRHLV